MCGRFVSAAPPDEIGAYFDAVVTESAIEPSYNVAPTDDVYAVRERKGVRQVDALHWGLVPSWADDPKIGSRMINARAESVADKAAFKTAFRKRRCIVPADGFYEWKKLADGKKQAVYLHRADGEPLAFAGLWEYWKREGDEGAGLRSCTIITSTANDRVGEVHDRMPVILPPAAWAEWLDPDVDDVGMLGQLLVPAPPALLAIRPVGPAVGNVRNNGPELIEPVDPAEPETLF